MKRILLGLLLGALIFGVSFAGAKVATVTNPMSADLDANSHAITNVSDLSVLNSADFQTGIQVEGVAYNLGDGSAISWLAGKIDPRGQFQASGGSLYTQRIGDAWPGTGGALWVKTGSTAADWTCIAGCAP